VLGTNVPSIRAHGRMRGYVDSRQPDVVADQGVVIVVGVDGSAGAAASLDFALAEGWKRQCTVEVVTAWLGSGQGDDTADSDELAEGRARVHRMQGEVIARCLDKRADVPDLLRVVVHDYAGRVLVARAEHASMVVVGSGSPSSVSHQVLGSVAEYCVRHAPVPVVIVPAPARLERRAAAGLQTS
jgi:nucleotide-binding universal stress UspA family protein